MADAGRRVLTPSDARAPGVASAVSGPALDGSAISLVVRGDKLPLRNAIASCFHADSQRLVVVTVSALHLYGHLLELGGELLGAVAADENVRFQFAMPLPWLDAYSVIATTLSGRIEHHVVSADFSVTHLTHVIAERATFYTAIANPARREVITADSDGGLKVWVLRSTDSTQPDKIASIKGFQRIHAGSRKVQYRYLHFARDEQTVLASTTSRIHSFDGTTCARLGTHFKDPVRGIDAMAFHQASDVLYLQSRESLRHLHKFQVTTVRGRMDGLYAAGTCTETEEIVAFEPFDQRDASSNGRQHRELDGIFLLDACGRLTVQSCCESDTLPTDERRSIALPLSPSSESYIAMYSESRVHAQRKFVVVVCSSGVVVVEVFLPGATWPGRRVITNIAGTRIDLLQSEKWLGVAIFNEPPPSLLLLDIASQERFSAMLLQLPVDLDLGLTHHSNTSSRDGHAAVSEVSSFCALADGIAVAWSSGDITQFSFYSEQTALVGRVQGKPCLITAGSPSSGGAHRDEWILVGNDRGAISLWAVHQGSATHHVCDKEAHTQRVLSIVVLCDNVDTDSQQILTIAVDGEVKLWLVHVAEGFTAVWDLLVCFRTYASTISATSLMGHEFLFCGSEVGGLECWRIPIIPSHSQATANPSSRRRNVAVIKKPLHSIDLHLSRICQVVVEPGEAANRIATAPPHLEEFAWVVTYDLDKQVLVWCCSTTFLFPHRKLLVHSDPLGGFMTLGDDSNICFYAYMGRCLDRIDLMGGIDKIATRKRLQRARESAAAAQSPHTQVHVHIEHTGEQQNFGGMYREPAAPMTLRITLPTVEQVCELDELESLRQHSTLRASRVKLKQIPSDPPTASEVTTVSMDVLPIEEPLWSQGNAIAPMPAAEPSVATGSRKARTIPSQRVRSRKPAGFGLETLPSEFQKANPHIYRVNSRVIPSLQTRCAVVTSSVGSVVSQPVQNVETTTTSGMDWGKESYNQDRLAIVTITDEHQAKELRLDFKASGSKKKAVKRTVTLNQVASDSPNLALSLVEWSSLESNDQAVELMAACRSRFVVEEAREDQVAVPTPDEFLSGEIKTQLTVRLFTRWYLSTSKHSRRRVREVFLREELRFAAQDARVIVSMKSAGCAVPPRECFGDENAPLWVAFMHWYATGVLHAPSGAPSVELESASMLTERLHERTEFLNRRLRSLVKAEKQSQGQSDPVYIFDVVPDALGSSADDTPSSWERLDATSRRMELVLALQDPMIQIAAIVDDVDLPDLSVASVDTDGMFLLTASFLTWWISAGNIHRQDFLSQELQEAAVDVGVRAALAPEITCFDLVPTTTTESFSKAYFRSGSARVDFLSRRLHGKAFHDRVTSISRHGKLPEPIMFEVSLPLVSTPFQFPMDAILPTQESHAADSTEDTSSQVDRTSEDFLKVGANESVAGGTDMALDDLQRQGEELAQMAIEDDLSQDLNNCYESASDDERDGDSMPLEPPKRTDFTDSYFFGSLPKAFRVNAGGWIAGSGIDNGDEEIEEEERLEKERNRQEMLDRQEAERIADTERHAERLRLEKEMDEKALQLRRIRLVELRKILVAQAELELRRAEQDEHENMMRERASMMEEERLDKQWLVATAAERAAMQAEEELALQIVAAERSARRAEIRRVLSETTQMDSEDRRSADVQAEQLNREQKRQRRVQSLMEIYEPFEPFFPESKVPSESMFPVIRQRLKQVSNVGRSASYALPFSEALVIDNVEQEHFYAARESRKLRQLMGLPVATPQSRRTMRIPTEIEIIKTRRDLQLSLEPTAESTDEENRTDRALAFGSDSTQSSSNQPDRQSKVRLPDLIQWKAQCDERLTDMSMVENPSNQHKTPNSHKSKPKHKGSSDRQQTSLPFFRGNFIVEGKSRSHAYAQK